MDISENDQNYTPTMYVYTIYNIFFFNFLIRSVRRHQVQIKKIAWIMPLFCILKQIHI